MCVCVCVCVALNLQRIAAVEVRASAPRTAAGTVAPARVRAATGLRASVEKGASVPRDAALKTALHYKEGGRTLIHVHYNYHGTTCSMKDRKRG